MKLSATSSLVLLWAGSDCHQSKEALKYLEQIDLSEGRELYQKCQQIYPHYDQVIQNRKYGIWKLIEKFLSEHQTSQVIICGAGLEPLSLEVLSYFPKTTIFEIERDSLQSKAELISTLEPNLAKSIHFIEEDLSLTDNVLSKLESNQWSKEKTTLLIMEGISYYINPTIIQNLVNVISPAACVFEYLKNDKDVVKENQHIYRDVFDLIESSCDTHVQQYGDAEINTAFEGMNKAECLGLNQLEKIRTQKNEHFPTDESGWINVAYFEN